MKHLHLIVACLLLAGCGPAANKPTEANAEPAAAIDEATTRTVLDHHFDAFKNNDLDATMADYAEESLLITPDTTYVGLEQIRANFARVFTAFPKDSTTYKSHQSVVQRDIAYIVWEASTPKFTLTYGTDTFVIQNGKIIRQTFAGVFAPR